MVHPYKDLRGVVGFLFCFFFLSFTHGKTEVG